MLSSVAFERNPGQLLTPKEADDLLALARCNDIESKPEILGNPVKTPCQVLASDAFQKISGRCWLNFEFFFLVVLYFSMFWLDLEMLSYFWRTVHWQKLAGGPAVASEVFLLASDQIWQDCLSWLTCTVMKMRKVVWCRCWSWEGNFTL